MGLKEEAIEWKKRFMSFLVVVVFVLTIVLTPTLYFRGALFMALLFVIFVLDLFHLRVKRLREAKNVQK